VLHQTEGALARDTAALDSAQLDLKRYETLLAEKLIPSQQYDQQKATVGQATGLVQLDQAAVEAARLNLNYARITAPVDGVTGIRQIDPGNLVHATDPGGIVMLTQLDPIAVVFTLPQDDLPRVAQASKGSALPVEVYDRSGAAKLGAGELALIDNQINQTTGTMRLKAILPNPDHILWPNLFVKARLKLSTMKNVLVIPTTALQRGPRGTFVYVVKDDQTVASRDVQVDLAADDAVVVRSGLSAGETVVVEGQSLLKPGARVQAHPPAPSVRGAQADRSQGTDSSSRTP
jgi:multidrug efflux system membrane fusion protein